MTGWVRRGIYGSVAVAAMLLGSTAAAVANTDTSTYAGYGSATTATHVSAWVTVPTVSCDGVASGTYAGQSLGAQLIGGGGIRVAADLRTYCDGSTPVYQVETVAPKTTTGGVVNFFRLSKLVVAPGDQVHLTVRASSFGSSVSVTDGAQKTHAHGPKLTGAVPYVVATTISATDTGKPLLHGQAPSDNPELPGPVVSTDADFSAVLFDKIPVQTFTGATAFDWVNGADQPVATTTASTNPRSFAIAFTP